MAYRVIGVCLLYVQSSLQSIVSLKKKRSNFQKFKKIFFSFFCATKRKVFIIYFMEGQKQKKGRDQKSLVKLYAHETLRTKRENSRQRHAIIERERRRRRREEEEEG